MNENQLEVEVGNSQVEPPRTFWDAMNSEECEEVFDAPPSKEVETFFSEEDIKGMLQKQLVDAKECGDDFKVERIRSVLYAWERMEIKEPPKLCSFREEEVKGVVEEQTVERKYISEVDKNDNVLSEPERPGLHRRRESQRFLRDEEQRTATTQVKIESNLDVAMSALEQTSLLFGENGGDECKGRILLIQKMIGKLRATAEYGDVVERLRATKTSETSEAERETLFVGQ